MRDGHAELTKDRLQASAAAKVAPERSTSSIKARARAARQVLHHASRSRLPPPPPAIVEVRNAGGNTSFAVRSDEDVFDVLGQICGVAPSESDVLFAPAASADFPLAQKLLMRAQAARHVPKTVRVDTLASGADFRAARRDPYVTALEERLAVLEESLAAHLADGHGASDVLGEAAVDAAEVAAVGGVRVPLSLPPWDKTTESWQDGAEVLSSIRARGQDGRVRILTTGEHVARSIEEIVGYVEDAGVDPHDVADALPLLAQVICGGGLVQELCAAAPVLLSHPASREPAEFEVNFASDASADAVAALIRLCRQGDRQACAEEAKLRALPSAAPLFARAEARLAPGRQYRRVL